MSYTCYHSSMTNTPDSPESTDKSADDSVETPPVLSADDVPPWQSRSGAEEAVDEPESDQDSPASDTDDETDEEWRKRIQRHNRVLFAMGAVAVVLILVATFLAGSLYGAQKQNELILSEADAQVLASVPTVKQVADALGVPKMVLGDLYTGLSESQVFDVNGAGPCVFTVVGPTPRTSVFTSFNAPDNGHGTVVNSVTFRVYSMSTVEDASEVASTVTVNAAECVNDVPQRETVNGSTLRALKLGNPVVADVRWTNRHDRSACSYLTGYANTSAYAITVCGTAENGMTDAALTLAGELNESLLHPLPYVPARR